MKRVFGVFLILVFLITAFPLYADALQVDSFNFDLGYSKDSLSNRNFSLQFDLELREEIYGFVFNSEIFRNQTPDSLNFYYATDAQINCFLGKNDFYLFANSGYNRDNIRGIEEIDTGIGLGMEFIFGRAQTGIFSKCSEFKDEIYSISMADLKIPTILANSRFDEKMKYEMNMRDGSDYVFTADSSLLVKMSKSVGLRAGLKYIYDNMPIEGSKDSRWWYGGINISF